MASAAGPVTFSQQVWWWAHMLDEAMVKDTSLQCQEGLAPLTPTELKDLEKMYGTTENFQESGWLLPDGKLLQMRRTSRTWTQHDGTLLPDSYYERVGAQHPSDGEDDGMHLDALDLMSIGFIRLEFSCNPVVVSMLKQPTRAQMDRLYDIADLDFTQLKDWTYKTKPFLEEFQLELPGKFIQYDDEEDFKRRFLNDVRNASF